MSTSALDRLGSGAAAPGRVGQATAVEQSRAVAEVHAAVVVAQQCPRDIDAAVRDMTDSCTRLELASRAFFRMPRGGEQITGPSIHLARELARTWRNVQYGVSEMRRDDEHRQSEMQAWAWDVQMNSRVALTFIVPHARDTRNGQKPLTELQAIYEALANSGARRVREAIFNILPTWFTEQAQQLCRETIEAGNGKPLPERIATALAALEGIGVTQDQAERKVGAVTSRWTAADVADLGVIYQAIKRGEVQRDDEFPPARVTGAEILAQPRQEQQSQPTEDAPALPDPEPAQPVREAPTAAEPAPGERAEITTKQLQIIGVLISGLGVTVREHRLAIVGQLAEVEPMPTMKVLTKSQATVVIDRLQRLVDKPEDERRAAVEFMTKQTDQPTLDEGDPQ